MIWLTTVDLKMISAAFEKAHQVKQQYVLGEYKIMLI